MINKIKGFILSSRLAKSLISSLLIFFISNSLYYSIIIFIFLLYSYIFNDLVDYDQDIFAHPNRALPKELLLINDSIFISISLFLLGLFFIIFFDTQYLLFYLIIILISSIYSCLLKKYIPSIATSIWSLLVTLIILFPLRFSFLIFFLIFTFFNSRELLLDLRDKNFDDKFCKTKSLPTLLGKDFNFLISLLALIALIISLMLNNFYIIIFCFLNFLLLIIFFNFKFNIFNLKCLTDLQLILFLGIVFI